MPASIPAQGSALGHGTHRVKALKVRPHFMARSFRALSFPIHSPRAVPWAGMVCTVGARNSAHPKFRPDSKQGHDTFRGVESQFFAKNGHFLQKTAPEHDAISLVSDEHGPVSDERSPVSDERRVADDECSPEFDACGVADGKCRIADDKCEATGGACGVTGNACEATGGKCGVTDGTCEATDDACGVTDGACGVTDDACGAADGECRNDTRRR